MCCWGAAACMVVRESWGVFEKGVLLDKEDECVFGGFDGWGEENGRVLFGWGEHEMGMCWVRRIILVGWG